jgi:Ca2+-binding RTX toxin-like protein
VANITMDLNGLENINFAAKGGADTITVGDLSGTGVKQVNLDLSGAPGVGDGAADTVIVNGTDAADAIQVAGSGTSYSVTGLAARVNVTGSEGANDALIVKAQGGDDVVDASRLAANVVQLTIDGGDGNDKLIGSAGGDLIIGGRGDDTALMGAGDDVFVWNPGDGNDTVEGQAGNDTLQFNGANVNEKIDVSANGSRVRFTRDVANITMDLNGLENINFAAKGGADTITIGDLSGTGVKEVNLDLGGSDGAADSVVVNGTNGDDVIVVAGDASGTSVVGLAARVNVTGAESANDRLTIQALGGDDVVQASGLAANAIQLTADGGAGNDVLIGGAGNNVLRGGDGDDVLIGGSAQNVLDGGPGSNTVIPG